MKYCFSIIFFILLLHSSNISAQNTDCGVERWDVKVLKDADTALIDFSPTLSSITEQTNLPKETTGAKDSRLASERNLYQMKALITQYKREDDGDIHLVIHDAITDSSMIAEIPNPNCPTAQGTSHIQQYADSWQWIVDSVGNPTTKFKLIDPPISAIIEGVGYYDPAHGQTGKAANNREIHPVLNIKGTSTQVLNDCEENTLFLLYPNPARGYVFIYPKP